MSLAAPLWIVKAALVAHAIAAGVLLGASTHFALLTLRARAVAASPRLTKLYPTVIACAWVVVAALGAWIYVRYRVRVRAEFLDPNARWASVLFDVKENFAVLVAPLALAQRLLSRGADYAKRPLARVLASVIALLCWFNAIAGLVVTSVRSV